MPSSSRADVAPPSSTGLPVLESIDPATGDVIARFDTTPIAEVGERVARARRVQQDWKRTGLRERSALLRRLRDHLFSRRQEAAEIVTREAGKPRVEAVFSEVMLALDTADFYARRAAWLRPERVPHHNLALKAKSGQLRHNPFGVIGIISPWNYPLSIPFGAVVAATVAGNAVVLKPSELTPWCGALVGELFEQAGFPAGLVQILQGGGEVGAAMIDAGPDKVFFTGSVPTGRRVAEACARRLIPSVLELGGKDAMLVLADADLDVASSAAVWGSFTNCGQACVSVERIFVEQGIAAKFTELCVAKAQKLRVGPGSDPDTELGPMIREQQVRRVEQQLEDAVARGATIRTGGQRRPDLGPRFFEPTVVTGVDSSMLLMREETFGPVLAIAAVEDAEAGLRLANESPFGLAGSVWTRDSRRGRELAERMHAGSVMVNDVASYYGACEAPHGGGGWSGWGRTHSRLGLAEMVQVQYVDVDRLPRMAKPWWFGYNESLAIAADRFVEFLFAPGWKARWAALASRRGAWRTAVRDHRI